MEPTVLGAYLSGDTLAKTTLGDLLKCLPLNGPAKILLLHRLPDELATTPEAKALFLRQAKQWAALRDLHTLNLNDSWEAGGALCYTMEYHPGRLLADVLERARQEGIPISPDQAVYLAERIAGSLQSLAGQNVACGCLSSERVLVTFEGEVKVLPGVLKDLQTTPLLASPLLDHYRRYLPPGQASGKVARGAADRYAVGALLFEFLSQQPFCPETVGFDPAERLKQAQDGLGGASPIPENLRAILGRCLLPDSPDTYPDLATLKADLDLLVSSGEYSPTTFNIAFLMHTLFRGEDEVQAASDQAFAALDRAAFRPAKPEPAPAAAPARPSPPPAPGAAPPVEHPSAEPPAQRAVEVPTFGVEPEPSRKGLWIGIGAAAVVAVIAVLGWMAFFRPNRPAVPDAQTQQQLAELARLKSQQEDLAKKLQTSEEEKQRLQAQIDTAKTTDEKQRAQKALEETQRRMQAQQEEQKRLASAVTEKSPSAAGGTTTQTSPLPVPPSAAPAAGGAPQDAPVAPPPANPQPAPPPTADRAPAPPSAPQPSAQAGGEAPKKVQAGDFVPPWAVDAKPKQLNELRLDIPSAARQNRVEGTIYVEVKIDETGAVTDAKIVKAIKGDYGMNEACRYAALKLRYSPALKDGVPVKTTLTFPIFVK